ncbi:hypothetical protein GW915_09680 [bacterium]|nr:hypothetical protein [bacterium]
MRLLKILVTVFVLLLGVKGSLALDAYWHQGAGTTKYRMVSKKYWLDCRRAIKHTEFILYTLGARNIQIKCFLNGRRYPVIDLNYKFIKLELEQGDATRVTPAYWGQVQEQREGMCGFYTHILNELMPSFPHREQSISSSCKGELGTVEWGAEALLPDLNFL